MNIIRNLKKHEVAIHLVSTFLTTWIFWSISCTSSNRILNGTFRIIGSFMPSTISVILIYYFEGRKGIKELMKKLIMWRVNLLFYLFILFYTVTSIYLPSFICTITGENYVISIHKYILGFDVTNPFMIVLFFLAIMLFGGPLGEEIGWRGFLLPRLLKNFNPLISSIVVGIVWVCWHLPLFYFKVEGYGNTNFILYFYGTIGLAIIFTWLYNNTGGSLLIPILYHAFDNFVLEICHPDFLNYINRYTIIYYAIQIVVLACITFYMIRKSVKK